MSMMLSHFLPVRGIMRLASLEPATSHVVGIMLARGRPVQVRIGSCGGTVTGQGHWKRTLHNYQGHWRTRQYIPHYTSVLL